MEIKISVRNLVEFVLRSGSIDNRFQSSVRALEGTLAHQKLQKLGGDNYNREVSLKLIFDYFGYKFNIHGRADGIIKNEIVVIDEIKSTTKNLENIEQANLVHEAQAKCYGYIYSKINDLTEIEIQISYFNIDTEGIKRFNHIYKYEELEGFFFSLIEKYLVWAKVSEDWKQLRDESINKLEFPFTEYREGQRKMAVSIYNTIKQSKKIFVSAPTGIGKTISTLFPGIKAQGQGEVSKIFYLTAKTVTRKVPEEAILNMRKNGLKLRYITITSKEKICFNEKVKCNPINCPYAKGHFDRVNDAMLSILENENEINREKIEEYARNFNVCPFEFSLDISLFCDVIICDYNYVFDPRAYLRRYFDESGQDDYLFLIDEAHNLVDRSRDMFSAEISKSEFTELKNKIENQKIKKQLNKINSSFLKYKKTIGDEGYGILKDEVDDLYRNIRKFIVMGEEYLLENEGDEEFLEVYFKCLSFIKISEYYDERYITYIEQINKNIKIKLFCMDPSFLLKEAYKRGKSAVLFSATLSPLKYYKDILGGEDEDFSLRLKSPFNKENRKILIADNISTKYKDRDKTYENVAEYIYSMYTNKQGNYLCFFPSYVYMEKVYEIFIEKYDVNTIKQESSMEESARDEYIDNFNEDNKIIGFCVLGGIFSEGIDLEGEKLIGVIVVSVGLPKICLERDIIKDYYNKKNNLGYEYSYMYPGMDKVLQAAGRLIRKEDDKGNILLIDTRFNNKNYLNIFPEDWFPYKIVKTKQELK
ncbi:MAG: helicase C-terminal domain-containing protein [Clostridiaceae bacterium]